MNSEFIEVHCAVPTKAVAMLIAKMLVEEQLCACVNIIESVTSIYRYEGEFCEDEEFLLLIKTDQEHFTAVETKILSLHPYDTPEIIALPILRGTKAYMDWVKKSLK